MAALQYQAIKAIQTMKTKALVLVLLVLPVAAMWPRAQSVPVAPPPLPPQPILLTVFLAMTVARVVGVGSLLYGLTTTTR